LRSGIWGKLFNPKPAGAARPAWFFNFLLRPQNGVLGLLRDWRPAAAIPEGESCSTQNLLALRGQLGFLISCCAFIS
jgi:hypothetical protein